METSDEQWKSRTRPWLYWQLAQVPELLDNAWPPWNPKVIKPLHHFECIASG
jgi:hypothetical protein